MHPNRIIEKIKGAQEIGEQKKTLKKTWKLQGDGDLWQKFWEVVKRRGWQSIKVTKVKGHAKAKLDQIEGYVIKCSAISSVIVPGTLL